MSPITYKKADTPLISAANTKNKNILKEESIEILHNS